MMKAGPGRQQQLARGLGTAQFIPTVIRSQCVGNSKQVTGWGCCRSAKPSPGMIWRSSSLSAFNNNINQAPLGTNHAAFIAAVQQQQPDDLLTKLKKVLQRAAMVVCLAPVLLLGFHSNDAAHAARKQAATAATASPYVTSTAPTSPTPQAHPSIFTLDVSKMTTIQAVQAVFMSPEGQLLLKIAAGVFLLYVVTRRPDPASPTAQGSSASGPVTKSWLISPGKAVEVDPSTLPQPPAAAPAPAAPPASNSTSRSFKARSPSVAASAFAGAASSSNSRGTASPPAATPGSASGGSGDLTRAGSVRADSPSRRASSSEPGVLAVGLTAAALESIAPLSKFVISGVVPAMMAAAKNTMTAIEASNAASSVPTPVTHNKEGVALVAWAAGTAESITGSAHSHRPVDGAAPAPSRSRSPSPVPTKTVVMAASVHPASPMTLSPPPAPTVLATPLTLNPVYPPSRGYYPRPVSLGATFRSSHSSRDVRTEAWGVLGALADLANKPLGQNTDKPTPELVPPSVIPSKPVVKASLDPALFEAAPVSSVVAYNLALASRAAPPELENTRSSPAPAALPVAVTGEEPVSRVVTRNLAESARLTIAEKLAVEDAKRKAKEDQAKAAAAAAGKAQLATATATTGAAAAGSSASVASADVAVSGAASKEAAVDSLKAVQGVVDAMESVMMAASQASSLLSDSQLASVEAVVSEVRTALHGKSTGEDGSGILKQEAAVERWTNMIRESPERAAAAVAEARAVADALVQDLEASMSTKAELGQREVSPEVAKATADALLGNNPKKPQQWYWAWAWALPDKMTSFLDPIRSLLRFKPPTARSKYDPMTFLRTWTPPSGNLPSWDPIQRLHAMLHDASAPKARSPPSKYDAIAQLVEFLASLPEVVASAEWAEAAAADPLRRLIADAAGRPDSTILSTATAIAQSKAHKERAATSRKFWSKYDPLADLFAPELPANAHWDEVVQEMLALEAVCGPVVPRFSALAVMNERGGQGFQSALMEFKQVAVSDEGAEKLKGDHPAISTWLQASSNVALANCAGEVKLGPVWGVLLTPRYQATLLAARGALPGLMRDLDRRHPSLHSLLKRRDPEQSLVLLSTLAAWVVGEEMAVSGRPPRTLSPSPAPAAAAAAQPSSQAQPVKA